LTSLKRPALVLYDGVEAVEDAFLAERKSARATRLVTMSPRIAIILDDREPQNDLTGEDLNANIHTISNAIEADADLADARRAERRVQYVGIDSELEWNRSSKASPSSPWRSPTSAGTSRRPSSDTHTTPFPQCPRDARASTNLHAPTLGQGGTQPEP
jgi:hypothetical protein